MGRSRSSDIDRFVGHRIKELRLRAGMTQRQVAQQLGVTDQQVHKIEKGINRVSAGKLLAIARLFDVPIADLFDGHDRGVPLDRLVDPKAAPTVLDLSRLFLALEPKHQAALVRLARAMAAES
jgi:transcriptional regulator with XRE-family HTH domain